MKTSRVWIIYRPKLYTDLFKRLFQSLGRVEIVDIPNPGPYFIEGGNGNGNEEWVDIVILSLGVDGKPACELVPTHLPDAKYVAFPPSGDYGLRRLPGTSDWEEVRPFGLVQLMREVFGKAG